MNITKVDGDTLLTIDGLMVSPECPVCIDFFRAAAELRLNISIIPIISGVEHQDRGSKGLSISVIGTVDELRAAALKYNLGLLWGPSKAGTLNDAVDEEIRRINEKNRVEEERVALIVASKERARQQRFRNSQSAARAVDIAQ